MGDNTAIQDRLQTTEQEAARPRIAFCQWMGLEMAKLDELLWMDFMDDAFALVTHYKRAQSQQPPATPPHPPPAVPPPPVQPQPQQPSVLPYSAPPQPSPSYRHQLNQPWQPGPNTSNEFQHQGWPSFPPSLSALNTSGLSSYLDPTPTVPGHTSSALSTPDAHRPGTRASSFGDGQRPSTSDVMRAAQHILDDEDNEPAK